MSKVYQIHSNIISASDLHWQIMSTEIAKYMLEGSYKKLWDMLTEYENNLENDEDLEEPEYDIDIVVKEENGRRSYFIRFAGFNGVFLYFKDVQQDEHLVDNSVEDWILTKLIYFPKDYFLDVLFKQGIEELEKLEKPYYLNRQELIEKFRFKELPQDF